MAKKPGTRVTTIPGYVVVEIDGQSTQYPLGIRVEDIPTGLTYAQVGAIKTLANTFAVLIRTLRAKNVLDATFLEEGEYTLLSLTEAIEEMGGDYNMPDISVS